MENIDLSAEEMVLMNSFFDAKDKNEILIKLEINRKILSSEDSMYSVICSLMSRIENMTDADVKELILLLPFDEFSNVADEEREYNEWYDNKKEFEQKYGITEDDGSIDDSDLEMPYSELADDWR